MFHAVCCLFHAKPCRLSDREKTDWFANYLSCFVSFNHAPFRCSSLNFKISTSDWNETSLKLHGVRLPNKCSKICVILNLDSLECRLVTTNLLPGVRLRILIGLWMMFYCFKLPSRRISWFFCSPGFQKSGYKLHINHKGGTLNSLNISEMSLMILLCMHVFLLASSLSQKGIFLGIIILIFFAYISKREFLLKWKLL